MFKSICGCLIAALVVFSAVGVQAGYNEGFSSYRDGDYEGAIVELSGLKDSVPSRYLSGLCYSKLGKHAEARGEFEFVVDKDPEHGKAYTNLARVLVKLKVYGEAIEASSKGVSLIPDSGAYNVLGQALMGVKDYEKADRAFAEAIEKDRRNVWAYNNRGYNLLLMSSGKSREKLEEALALFKKALELAPENKTVLRNKAYAEKALKKVDFYHADYFPTIIIYVVGVLAWF